MIRQINATWVIQWEVNPDRRVICIGDLEIYRDLPTLAKRGLQLLELVAPPDSKWEVSRPVKNGVSQEGIGFYAASFHLDIPDGWDVSMSIVFNQSCSTQVVGSTGANY